jgi:hypothetical protein
MFLIEVDLPSLLPLHIVLHKELERRLLSLQGTL